MRGEYNSSSSFKLLVRTVANLIKKDAKKNGRDLIGAVCHIYQTGLARQQHYCGHMRPVIGDSDIAFSSFRGIDVDACVSIQVPPTTS